jgi:hypothetical protein
MSAKAGRYVFVRADGLSFEANAGNFAALLGMLEPQFKTFNMPFVNLVHWAPGKKMKPLPDAVMAIIRREESEFASVAWAEFGKNMTVYSLAVHGKSDPWPISKTTGRSVSVGRLIARLQEAWGYTHWRRNRLY